MDSDLHSQLRSHQEEELRVLGSFSGVGQEKPWREVREPLDHLQEPGLGQESCLGE